jgi:predicted phosphoadenosine phosphosulfate sulfurtransferase
MIRIHNGDNVLEAAMKRLRYLFEEFEGNICVSTSGGKDSTVVFELCRIVAAEYGQELNVMWLDQECEYTSTVDYVRWQMHQPGIKPFWFQVPFRLTNATSHDEYEEFLHVWDPEHPEKWMREKEPDSFHDNVYGVDRFGKMLGALSDYHFPGGANVCGMRAEEAPGRRVGLTGAATYKWITWGWIGNKHFLFSPIYDWTWRDVWKCIQENGWKYNTHYDALYQYGVPTQNMRVSNYHHETAIWSLFHLQEIEPESYARATQRLEGIHTAAHLGKADYKPKTLPFMFDTWLSYRDHLVNTLCSDKNRPIFQAKFASLRERFPVLYEEMGEQIAKAECYSVIMNDWEFVLLDGTFFQAPPELMKRNREVRKAQKKEAALA